MTGVQTCALPICGAATTEIYTRPYTLSLHDALPIPATVFGLWFGAWFVALRQAIDSEAAAVAVVPAGAVNDHPVVVPRAQVPVA